MHALLDLTLLSFLLCLGGEAHGSEIVNGGEVPDGKMPYMVSVQNDGGHICGGFLINAEFVMTAAHCDKLKPTHVVLGSHDLNKTNKKMRIKIKKCKHEDFTETRNGKDIMLLQLTQKVKLNNKVKPVQLPKSGMNVEAKTQCTVAGWGKTQTRGEQVKELLMANVSVITLEQCTLVWKKSKVNLPDNVVCAGGYRVKQGFCQGDSGGPLVCGGMAVGIVSFNYNYKCNYPDHPNVYTDVSKYMDWINKTVKQKKCK